MKKSSFALFFAKYTVAQQKKWALRPEETQQKMLANLLKMAKNTQFGKDHHFADIKNYEDFKKAVPIREYEDFKPYIERVLKGEKDILWKGKPLYFAKTSGTTSGTKYIPISAESMPFHIQSARDALLSYAHETKNADFIDRKLIFLSGSPILDKKNGILTGRLSGIVNHHVPSYLRRNQLPSYQTNCIEDWENKLDKIIEETLKEDMSLISGIPPWVQMYFDRIMAKTGKKIKDVFPNFSLFVQGGVNFQPYSARIYESIGRRIDTIETYPASEGFIAYQDSQIEEGLLTLLNHGMFFEFIPADEYFKPNPTRLSIDEVKVGVSYALIINSNAGLWGYSIGDTVRFVSKYPHRLRVSGRIKHFISAFGEHVIGSEVEASLKYAMDMHKEVEVLEFTVAPQVTPSQGLPYHEWLIAFAVPPRDMLSFSRAIDKKMCELNSYYNDLIKGNILRSAVITPLKEDAFIRYMKSQGKLGGQNKVPHLSNTRDIANLLNIDKL
jgi:GH3 auxin-responsive promoter